MLSRFTQIDYDREMAMIAVLGTPPHETQIGVARYVTLPNGETCEFAVVVADEWQGKGVAVHLVRPLIEHARAKGLTRAEGVVLTENTNMLRFAKASGFTIVPDRDDPSLINVSLDL
jgi:acetyltransferase